MNTIVPFILEVAGFSQNKDTMTVATILFFSRLQIVTILSHYLIYYIQIGFLAYYSMSRIKKYFHERIQKLCWNHANVELVTNLFYKATGNCSLLFSEIRNLKWEVCILEVLSIGVPITFLTLLTPNTDAKLPAKKSSIKNYKIIFCFKFFVFSCFSIFVKIRINRIIRNIIL